MANTKTYKTPFWSLIVLMILIAVYDGMVVTFLIKSHSPNEFVLDSIWQSCIYIFILLVESLLYWILRKRILKKSWALIHVALLYFALIFLAILFVVSTWIAASYYSPSDYGNFMRQISNIRRTVFWCSIIAAHIFFIATIVKGFSNKNISGKSENESADLLNEFTA